MTRKNVMTALLFVLAVSLLIGSANAQTSVKARQASIDAQIARAIETAAKENHGTGPIRNVIVLIPDGCSQSVMTVARWFKGEDLTLDGMHAGVMSTEMANSVITGSAAASTAFSTGFQTTVRFLGVGPRPDDVLSTYEWPLPQNHLAYRPVATVLEGAKLRGKSTGLISTSRFTHATPAGYACHSLDRGNENTDISEHMVYNEIDLVFGGGERNLVPTTEGGKRTDGENLLNVLVDRGYDIIRTKTEMAAQTDLPVYGMFAWSHMDSEIDRPTYNPEEPALADMTAKALELLSQNPYGFFLMVESSQVDWGGHNNDPIYMTKDFIEFDEAAKVAKDFADANPSTLVIGFPDHNCGGMDIGNRDYNGAYTHLTVEELVDPLKGMTVSAGALAGEISDMPGGITVGNIQSKTLELWGIDVSADVAQEIIDLTGMQEGQDGYTVSFGYALARTLSKHYTAIGWTSHGHNGEDVPFWAYGANAPSGTVKNIDMAKFVAQAFNLDMQWLNEYLFVDLDDHFPGWTLDTTDPENPVAVINGGWAWAELPCSKDLCIIHTSWGTERTYNVPGLTVYVPETGKVFVPGLTAWIIWLYGIA